MENKHRVDGDMSLVKRMTAAPVENVSSVLPVFACNFHFQVVYYIRLKLSEHVITMKISIGIHKFLLQICPSIYIDKKRIACSVCAELVERKMLAGNKARIIEPDRSEEYSGFVSIHQVISPVLMVIKLAAWPAMAKSRKTDLENALAKHWVAKKKSFDMVNDFPGKWMVTS